PQTNSAPSQPAFSQDALRSMKTTPGYLGSCWNGHHLDGEPPPWGAIADRGSFPSQGDAREHSRGYWLPGDPACVLEHTPTCQSGDHPSMTGFSRLGRTAHRGRMGFDVSKESREQSFVFLSQRGGQFPKSGA